MSATCPDCGRPFADRMPDAISPKGPCARQWHPVGADDCMALTLEKLRRELAEANAKLEARAVPEVVSMGEALEQLDHLRISVRAKLMYPSEERIIRAALESAESQLAAAQQVVELNAAERALLDCAMMVAAEAWERVCGDPARHLTDEERALVQCTDTLLALRAAAKPSAAEGEG